MSIFTDIISGAQKTILSTSVAGVTVKYADSTGANWTMITAVPGKTDFQVEDQNGAISQFRSRDYIVSACDIVINGIVTLPQRGHTITEQIGKQNHVYEVSRPDGSDQPYRYSNVGHEILRIHTKLKAVTNV